VPDYLDDMRVFYCPSAEALEPYAQSDEYGGPGGDSVIDTPRNRARCYITYKYFSVNQRDTRMPLPLRLSEYPHLLRNDSPASRWLMSDWVRRDVPVFPHQEPGGWGGGRNVLFADGRVEFVRHGTPEHFTGGRGDASGQEPTTNRRGEMADTDDAGGANPARTFAVRTVGYVRSEYANPDDVAHTHHTQEGWTTDTSKILLLPKYAHLLGGLRGYSHLIVLFWMHRAKEWQMPKHHHKPPHVKVFATRMPVRPNPIGLSVVELLDFSTERGEVTVKGLDAVDGTPILDIKPYMPNFDSYADAQVPEWVGRHRNSHFHDGQPHAHHTHKHPGESDASVRTSDGE